MSLARPALLVGLSTVVSRILGLARDSLIAALVGAGPVGDALLVALRIPNLFRRILSEGGLNAGFVPLHARVVREEGEEAAARFAGEALATLAAGLAVLLIGVQIFAATLVIVIAAGTRQDPAIFSLTVDLTRLCAPFVVAATLASLLAAVLNAKRRFAAAALAPVVAASFVVGVLGVLALNPPDDPARSALIAAGAVGISGLVHLGFLTVTMARTPGAVKLVRPRLSPRTRSLLVTAGPVLAVSGAAQLMILASTQVASFTPGAVSWLYFADRLLQFPLGFVAVVVGVVLLPEIAERAAAEDRAGLTGALNRALEAAFVLSLPAAAALTVLASLLCRVLFEHGAFDTSDTGHTAAILQGLAPGLLAAAAGKVLSQLYFARRRLAPALIASGAGLIATLLAAALLSGRLGPLGLGLGVSAGLAVHAGLLALFASRLGLWRPDRRLLSRTGRAILATLVMTLTLAGLMTGLDAGYGAAAALHRQVLGLAVLCIAGFAVFALGAHASGAVTREDLRHLLRRADRA